jgi:hypothetical protein
MVIKLNNCGLAHVWLTCPRWREHWWLIELNAGSESLICPTSSLSPRYDRLCLRHARD